MRVLVTRPEPDARRTAQKLIALGHEPLVAPLLRIEPTPVPPPPLEFDAVLLTSANAAAALPRLGARKMPVFAVGERTAALARQVNSDTRSAAGDARSLAALVARSLPPEAVLLHVAGADRKPEPKASLRAAGYRVVVWEAYAARAAERLPDGLAMALAAGGLDAALHFSRRSAGLVVQLAEGAGMRAALLGLGHACLSDDVAAPLRAAGAGRIALAAAPDEGALLAALARLAPTTVGGAPPGGDKDGTNPNV